jgi:alkylation response protein AidB-like acyl-CoA dehydrogenase
VPDMDTMQHPEMMPALLKKAGEMGLLGIGIPEQYGGLGLDFTTGMLTTEVNGMGHSYSVAMAAHTGIGTLPILYYGTEEQKAQYVPKLATGEWLAAYCLTEPGSGSDALGAKTKAVLNAEGTHYVLNGQKMWITNGGFADVFIVFAKIDGEKFTGFIVEKGTPGLTMNEEEKKMGIKGSSTRQLFLTDVHVPVQNLLGEIGKGHHIAFNILNIGRLKLCAACLGASKAVATLSVKYANERSQFNQHISSFGAIQHKLAEQAIRIWVCESATYRATEYVHQHEERLRAEGETYEEAIQAAAREYAVECAMLKVAGSECLDFVVDEGVQIYGGYGYSADFPMDRAYRDSRINRIFEGTNEINRMLTLNDLFRKAMKGEVDLFGPAMAIQRELLAIPDFTAPDMTSPFWREEMAVKGFKKACLMTAGLAAKKYAMELEHQQELLMYMADMMIQTFQSESALLRVKKMHTTHGAEAAKLPKAIVQTWFTDAAERIGTAGRNVLYSMSDGDELRVTLMGLKRFTKIEPFNTVAARRAIAAELIEQNEYAF